MTNAIEATAGAEPVDATNESPEVVEPVETGAEGTTSSEDAPEAPKELTEAEKAAKALKRRVDRLTREKYEERARFQAELEQARQQRPAAQAESTEPKPVLAEQDIESRARAMATELAEAQAFNQKCNQIAAEGKKLSPTFDADLKTLRDEVAPLFKQNGAPTEFMLAILDADAPARLLTYLAKNLDTAEEIEALPHRQQIRKIALLEQSLGEASKPKPSTAPKPVAPVRGGSASSEPDAAKDPQAWIAWRNGRQASR